MIAICHLWKALHQDENKINFFLSELGFWTIQFVWINMKVLACQILMEESLRSRTVSLKNSYVKMISYPRIIRRQCIIYTFKGGWSRNKTKREAKKESRQLRQRKICTRSTSEMIPKFSLRQGEQMLVLRVLACSNVFIFYCWLLFLAYAYMLFHSSYPIAREMELEFCIEAAFTIKQRILRILLQDGINLWHFALNRNENFF